MSGELIINTKDNKLADQMRIALDKSSDISFLVGYFYFSGFEQLYDKIADRKMKILVGLDVDVDIYNVVRECEEINITKKYKSNDKIRNTYYEHLVNLFKTDIFDDPEKEKAFKLFINKITNGSLEIRKTKEPNHSKLYLFKADGNVLDPTQPGDMILGSSNFSISGLKNQNELNVIFHDTDYNKGKEIFDKLWETATPIADLNLIEEFKEKVINKIWIDKNPSPYLMYLRVLNEYFSSNLPDRFIKTPSFLTNGTKDDLAYQTDAIKGALAKIEKHNGVLIADVVGLGKSIIGTAIAANLDMHIVIICPKHLVDQWSSYAKEFGIFGKTHIYKDSKIDNAVLDFANFKEQILVIIDEAHKHRNENNNDYQNLKRLCNGNKVVLLIATPFNNKPKDIYNLICLFQIPGKSTIKNVDNFGEFFEHLISEYKDSYKANKSNQLNQSDFIKKTNKIAKDIQNLIAPITIRRSRKDLQEIKEYRDDLKRLNYEFAKVNAPKSLNYDLGDIKDIYIYTLESIYPETKISDESELKSEENIFNAARYKTLLYVKQESLPKLQQQLENEGYEDVQFIMQQSQQQLAKFIRRLLVFRFESSIFAFKSSLESLIKNYDNILKWIEHRNTVPIYKKGNLPDIESLKNDNNDNLFGIDDALEEQIKKLEQKGLFEISCNDIDKDKYLTDLNTDITILKDIHNKWFSDGNIKFDPKLDFFIKEIQKQIKKDPSRKIVVFSGYADTVNYLSEKLKQAKLRVFSYTSAISSDQNRQIIQTNFDAGIQLEKQSNDYDILIATDAISEGFNLHRAGTIFNYDIPYNPTRVIQRVGRINRINKKVFDELFIYNFFPTYIGEAQTRINGITKLKMRMINMIMGNDTQVLSEDEVLKRFNNSFDEEKDGSDQLSWDAEYINDWKISKNTNEFKQALDINPRTRIGRVGNFEYSVIIFGKYGNECIFKNILSDESINILMPEQALPIFKANTDEKVQSLSDNFNNLYQKLKSKLFQNKEPKLSNIQGKARAKIVSWLDLYSDWKDYLEDLINVIELGDVPNYRIINKAKNPEELSKQITKEYLQRTLNRVEQIEAEPETVILSEELSC